MQLDELIELLSKLNPDKARAHIREKQIGRGIRQRQDVLRARMSMRARGEGEGQSAREGMPAAPPPLLFGQEANARRPVPSRSDQTAFQHLSG